MKNPVSVVAVSLGLLAVACSPVALAPIEPDTRFELSGFSIASPSGAGWGSLPTSRERTDIGLAEEIIFGKVLAPDHSFVARLRVTIYSDLPMPKDSILNKSAGYKQKELSEGRYKAISFASQRDNSLGMECLRYDALSEDHGAASTSVAYLIMTEHGYLCLHPQRDAVATTVYSERLPAGETPLTMESEGDQYLRSLRALIGGHSKNLVSRTSADD